MQVEAALRKLVGIYAYDNFEETEESTLRQSCNLVNEMLVKEIEERISMAGVSVIEARISHLAYATEIAHSMLMR